MRLYSRLTRWPLYSVVLGFGAVGLLNCSPKDILSSEKVILAFALQGFTINSTVLDAAARTVATTVPYGTDRSALIPVFTLSSGSSCVPASGQPTDLRQPGLFTLTAADGSKIIYVVTVKTAPQPSPVLTSLSQQSIEAGQSLQLKGQLFGISPQAVSLKLTRPDAQTLSLAATLIDSVTLRSSLPFTLPAALYQVQVVVAGLQSLVSLPLTVQYPAPVINALTQRHLLAGDSLLLSGQFILADQYRYQLRLASLSLSHSVDEYAVTPQGLLFAVPPSLPAGLYQVNLQNSTFNKQSRDNTQFVQIYEATKPFIRAINQPKNSYGPGETVNFKTVSFGTIPARFYQCQLKAGTVSYAINGVYSDATKLLTLTLPATIKPADYQLGTRLLAASGEILYSFDTNLLINVR